MAIRAPDDETRAVIRNFRDELLAEHLGLAPAQVTEEIDRRGSVVAALAVLCRPEGRSLRPLPPRRETWLGSALARTRFFDPRYRRSAQARLGITSRHLLIGTAVLAAGAWLWGSRRQRG